MIRCISLFLILFPLLAFSQNETDLYRYSRTTYGGSARFESMAGSFGALGADMSCSQTNPAGMGRFSSSKAEMTFFWGASAQSKQFQPNCYFKWNIYRWTFQYRNRDHNRCIDKTRWNPIPAARTRNEQDRIFPKHIQLSGCSV